MTERRNTEYRKDITKELSKIDGYIAIVFIVITSIALYWYAKYNKTMINLMSDDINLFKLLPFQITILMCIYLVLLMRKQRLKSICISKKHLGKSLILGLVVSLPILAIKYQELINEDNYIEKIIYLLIGVALFEEVLIRGFVAPRLQVLFKRRWIALIVGGILFGTMHVPFYTAINDISLINGFVNYLSDNVMGYMLFHILTVVLASRYDNILPAVLLHLVMDF